MPLHRMVAIMEMLEHKYPKDLIIDFSIKLIEAENARRKKNSDDKVVERNPYADIKPEIKINPAYFEAMGKDVPI